MHVNVWQYLNSISLGLYVDSSCETDHLFYGVFPVCLVAIYHVSSGDGDDALCHFCIAVSRVVSDGVVFPL